MTQRSIADPLTPADEVHDEDLADASPTSDERLTAPSLALFALVGVLAWIGIYYLVT